jgi:hypothetical protein
MVVADPAGTFVYADSSGNARAAFFSAAIRPAHPAGHETTAVPVDSAGARRHHDAFVLVRRVPGTPAQINKKVSL